MARLGRLPTLCAAGSIIFAYGCAEAPDAADQTAVEQESRGHTEIHTEDNCDPATFGTLCNPNFPGTTTLDQFRAELDATKRVARWEYGGGQIRVGTGQSFQVDNEGG